MPVAARSNFARPLAAVLSCLVLNFAVHADPSHVDDDQFWRDAAALLPGWTGNPPAPTPTANAGVWSAVRSWPHVPVSAALLPTGKLLTYSGQENRNWPGTATRTRWTIYDPATDGFSTQTYDDHEMFCAALVMRSDGVLQTTGGRYTVRHSSRFDFRTGQWSRATDMFGRRWYNTSVALPNGDVLAFSGKGSPTAVEEYDHNGDSWRILGGLNWTPGTEEVNWPHVLLAPDGRLFHFGPTEVMHWVDAEGNGSLSSTALQVPGTIDPVESTFVMYDIGKVLSIGGYRSPTDKNASDSAFTVDFNTIPPVLESLPGGMIGYRQFANAIVLPNGEVLILGGNSLGRKFTDAGGLTTAEIWNPETGAFRAVASMAVPRGYHSTAMLLPDGRVFCGGGGYGGNGSESWNHDDAQFYTPPALLDAGNNPLSRPALTAVPESVACGSVFEVDASPGIASFAAIRLSSTTHAMNTDQRRVTLPFSEVAPGEYRVIAHPNPNVLVPGYWMFFAVRADGCYSPAKMIHVREAGDEPSTAIADGGTRKTASVSVSGVHELYVDGQLIGIGTDAEKTYATSVNLDGATIAIRARNTAAGPHFVGDFTLNGRRIVTGEDWKVTTSASGAWTRSDYDDTGWSSATVLGDVPGSVRGMPDGTAARNIWSGSTTDGEVFFRFTLPATGISAIPSRDDLVGAVVSFQVTAWGPAGAALTFSATGLPPGVSLDSASGVISGRVDQAGSYAPTVTVTDGAGGSHAASFSWVVREERGLLREWWNGIGGVNLSGLTSHPNYPDNPSGSEIVTAFPIALNTANNYGSRVRGYLHPPSSGAYRFRLSTDDEGELLLGASVATATRIAYVPGWASVNEWTKYPQQTSGEITLQAGERYYFEVVQKEAGGGDHINVIWRQPGAADYTTIDFDVFSPHRDNTAPTLAAIPDQAHTIGAAVSLAPAVVDPDNDVLTFAVTGLPDGLGMDPDTGLISGTLTAVGEFSVSVTVADGTASATQSFTWVVNPALELAAGSTGVKVAGESVNFTASASGGTGVTYVWNFGDGTPDTASATTSGASHTFDEPGRYRVTVTATDANGAAASVNFIQNVRAVLTTTRPASSSAIIAFGTGAQARVWNVNPDNDTVSVSDGLQKLNEIAVGDEPRSLAVNPSGEVWVVNKASAGISIIRNGAVSEVVTLPPNSRPHGIVFSPDGTTAYVALEAGGGIVLLDVASRTVGPMLNVGDHPRHLAINADGTKLYVSRFISPTVPGEATATPRIDVGGGEVLVVDTGAFAVMKTILLAQSTESDFGGGARGLPNYLGAMAISPDDSAGWVPSKQDNIHRGLLRDTRALNHENTVRAVTSRIELSGDTEDHGGRVDHDDAAVPSAAVFGPYGLHVFVALEGSRDVAVIDARGRFELLRFDVGHAPQGLALSADGARLHVHNFMSRSVSTFDISELVDRGVPTVTTLAEVGVVGSEALTAEVLRGKRLFYDARDNRLAHEDYMSCASCHNAGGHDGRVWDLGGFGEGLRNTIDLRGRGGMAHGRLHWSANFDEVQDFEGQIRELSGGTGLIANGTPHPPLGTPNAGRDPDLDALAAYLASLSDFAGSPHRDQGALTANAIAGRQVFRRLDCAKCHSGAEFTDSLSDRLHDIGTLKSASGNRLGQPLTGLDTPTLKGLWDGAPFLHDGSAATVRDAILAHSSSVANGEAIAGLPGEELDQLVAYVLQIDDNEPSAPTNSAPVLATVPNQTTAVGEAVNLVISATDADGDTLVFSANGLPAGLSVSSETGIVQGSPGAPGTYRVRLTVSDPYGGTDETEFDWTVTGSDAPAFVSGFEAGQTEWGSDGTTAIVRDANDARDGENFLRIPAATDRTVVQYLELSRTLWRIGGTYSLEFHGRVSANANGTGEAGFSCYDADYNELASANVVVTSTSWESHLVGPVIVPENTAVVEFWALKGADSGHADFDAFRWFDQDATPPGPSVNLTTPAASVSGEFEITVTFGESITGLSGLDFDLGNGEFVGLSGSGADYTLTVKPLASPVTVALGAGKVQNAAGRGNQPSPTLTVLFSPPPGGVVYQHGFEDGEEAWGASGASTRVSDAGAAAGRGHLRITAAGAETSVGYHQVPAGVWSPGGVYQLEFSGRLTAGGTGAAVGGLTFFDANYQEIPGAVTSIAVTGNEWGGYRTDALTVPDNARFAEIWALKGEGTGSGEFDEFRIVSSQPPPPPSDVNLLENGGFENLKDGWWESGTGARLTEVVTGNQHEGTRSLRIPAAGGGVSRGATAVPGSDYTLRLWAYREAPVSWVGFGVAFYDGAGAQMTPANPGDLVREITAAVWSEHVNNFTAPIGARTMTVWIWHNGGDAPAHVDAIRLEQ